MSRFVGTEEHYMLLRPWSASVMTFPESNDAPPLIRDTTFQYVRLRGPALLYLDGCDVDMEVLDVHGSIDSVLWPIMDGDIKVGAIKVENCRFKHCRFECIGFVAPPETALQFREIKWENE